MTGQENPDWTLGLDLDSQSCSCPAAASGCSCTAAAPGGCSASPAPSYGTADGGPTAGTEYPRTADTQTQATAGCSLDPEEPVTEQNHGPNTAPHLPLQGVRPGLGLVQLALEPACILHVLVFQRAEFVLQDLLPLLQRLQAAAEDLTLLLGTAGTQSSSSSSSSLSSTVRPSAKVRSYIRNLLFY